MIFRIEPQPTPAEAEAIELAIERLMGHREATTKRLRYRDVTEAQTALWTPTWRDAARIELLDPGV